MALHLARPKHRFHSKPSLFHLFSTSSSSSSSSSSPQDGNESGDQSSSSDFKISSYISNIKISLNQPQEGNTQFSRFVARTQNPTPSLISPGDVRRNLNEFRSRSSSLSSPSPSHVKVTQLESMKRRLRHMRPQAVETEAYTNIQSLKKFMKMEPIQNVKGEELPMSVFGDEIKQEKKNKEEIEEMKSEFIKNYQEKELGDILRMYRPQGKKEEGWFSLKELNQRLVKLREVEEESAAQRSKTGSFQGLRASIHQAMEAEAKSAQASSNVDFMNILSGTPKYLLEPPKEHLVDTYYHTDNMSSADKMKIELAKVREDFKMSESDCGSARVQVAQLTTKIKHLSSVLHKKDKHSRKGLIAMVQRRKKLLKYMRRTDWNSYCISLSKLGLRDNPDYKF